MATFNGRDGVVQISDVSVAEVSEFTYTLTRELDDITVRTLASPSPSKEFIKGPINATGTITCFWDDTDTTGQIALQTSVTAGSTVEIALYPEGTAEGDYKLSCSAYVSDISVSNITPEGKIQATFNFQSTGDITIGTVPAA